MLVSIAIELVFRAGKEDAKIEEHFGILFVLNNRHVTSKL